MLTSKQNKVWRYVEEGRLLKLKSYLRKNPGLNVDFSHGKRQRTPLHLACGMRDDAMLRLLLKHGADVLRQDSKGDTALHVAVNVACTRGKTGYDDLVLPLKAHCPAALNVSNNLGITPADLIKLTHAKKNGMETHADAKFSRPSAADKDKEFLAKLFDECQDEFSEPFDADDFLPVDDDEEEFGDWADRIRQEYYTKKHADAQRLASSSSTSSSSTSSSSGSSSSGVSSSTSSSSSSGWKGPHRKCQTVNDQHQINLIEKLRKDYLAQEERKKEEIRKSKKRRYEEGCAATFKVGPSAATSKLSYSDIPWPAPQGTVKEMVAVILYGVDRKDNQVLRKMLLKQQTLWHPDKFIQRCAHRLAGKDKQRILDTVTALSQELNSLVQSLKKA